MKIVSLDDSRKPGDGSAEPAEVIDIHDRVTEAYFGKMGVPFMRETQERVHWICANVAGKKILEVGCSQGIVSILLGRAGKTVTGVDVAQRSIGQAADYLRQESPEVRERVTFLHADFLDQNFDHQTFDTIVIAEVLEHLLLPESFIDTAASLLPAGGNLIVTVPFGINDFIDHKRTYYLLEPYRLISEKFEVVEVALLGKWLGLVGRRRKLEESTPSSETLGFELVSKLEKAFFAIERVLRDEEAKIRAKLNEANLKYRAVTEQVATLKERVAQEELARKQAESALLHLQQQLDARDGLHLGTEQIEALREQLSEMFAMRKVAEHSVAQLVTQLSVAKEDFDKEKKSRQEEVDRLVERLEAQRELRHEAETRLVRIEAEKNSLSGSLNDANLKYRTVTEQIATLKQRLREGENSSLEQQQKLSDYAAKLGSTEEERIRLLRELDVLTGKLAFAEQSSMELRSQLSIVEERLDAEQTARYEEVERLGANLEAQQESLHRAEASLAALEAERVAVTMQLGELREELAVTLAESHATKNLLSEHEEQVRAGRERIAALSKQLTLAEHDFEANKAELEKKESELETTSALLRADQHENQRLKIELLQAKKSLTDRQREIERLRQQKSEAENQVIKTRAMLSFQLGYILLHGFKSFGSFVRLPGKLLEFGRELRRRRAIHAAKMIGLQRGEQKKGPSGAGRSQLSSPRQLFPNSIFASLETNAVSGLKVLKVACIMDEFTFSSFHPECNLLQLSVQHWQKELENFSPEMLFIESAWRGKNDQWSNKVGHLSAEVVGIVEWCREHKTPTVFWNKEDPVHFETFLNTARMFDYVFTTDIDCIHRYKAALGHDRVYLLPFACQPLASNPVETYQRKDAFCFAGAYYARYPERTRDLGNFMTALSEYKPVEIYDRNYGKDDPNYQFPPEYHPFIVGNLPFDQIDKAYKGYRYSINLNSIKQSQSMFARRVFELLASNTITVSNFSRAVRLMFGDLVITTDSGSEIVRRLQALDGDESVLRKFRLAGLRKVMMSHTYQDRLAYVVSKVQGKPGPSLLPGIVVTGYAKNQEHFDALLTSFRRQNYLNCRFVAVVPGGFSPENVPDDGKLQVLSASAADQLLIGELTGGRELVAGMVPDDYYGPNYLLDLALATRYSSAHAIGKATYHVWSTTSGLSLAYPNCQYLPAQALAARCALVQPRILAEISLREWVTSLYTRQIDGCELLSVDEFNYCKNGGAEGFNADQVKAVDDLGGLDAGLSVEELILRAERILPQDVLPDDAPVLTGEKLASYFKPSEGKGYSFTVDNGAWEVVSNLADGQHEYLYATTDFQPAELGFKTDAMFYLETTPGLNLQLAMLFLDGQKQRISHVIKGPNRNQEAAIPLGAEWIRLGVRIYGRGEARINALVLGHRPLRPSEVLGRAEHLVLTNHYPSYEDLYRNGFVHSRVAAYAERGVLVDVFRLRKEEALSFHEFSNIDVMTGSQEALHKLLASGKYKSVLVHFLNEDMWEVLKHHIDEVKVFIWVHGAEIQAWHRRDYNFANEQERDIAKRQSEIKLIFWKNVIKTNSDNFKFVFVSKYLADAAMEDIAIGIEDSKYVIIHNPIDTDLFSFSEKPVEQRKRILSIRPYTSKTYANDLSVKTIVELSKKPYFNELEFRLVGDGALFDDVLEPVRQFENVYIEKRFMTHEEISILHREYGVFLCPTRMDSQGVSRDEAMSSGLVPLTNSVAAIPEFVDETCAFLAQKDEINGLVNGVDALYRDPELFSLMSRAASNRVQYQSAKYKIIDSELALFEKNLVKIK